MTLVTFDFKDLPSLFLKNFWTLLRFSLHQQDLEQISASLPVSSDESWCENVCATIETSVIVDFDGFVDFEVWADS